MNQFIKKYKKILIILIVVGIYLLPVLALADTGVPSGSPPPPQPLSNPLGEADPRKIIGNIIKALLGIIGSIALAVFIYGGFTWMTSAGSPEKVRKGRDMIIWAVMGLAIIFLSYTVVYFVIGAFTGI